MSLLAASWPATAVLAATGGEREGLDERSEASPAPHPRLIVERGRVAPRHAYVAGAPVRVGLVLRSAERQPVRVEVRRRGEARTLAEWRLLATRGVSRHAIAWDGRRADGRGVGAGVFRLRLAARGERRRSLGSARLAGHAFPVRGPHGERGAVGRFGASRVGGRTHEGFDVTAPCRTPLVAARGGRVVAMGYDHSLYGHFLRVTGRGNRLGYFYSHLSEPPLVDRGDRVRTGQRIGLVGDTGNARGTGCHLHFELRRAGRLVDPEPALRRWQRRPGPLG